MILAPIVDIPRELEKLFVVLEHRLPDREQLTEIARGIATEDGELPEGDELQRVIDAAAGLSRFEAEVPTRWPWYDMAGSNRAPFGSSRAKP